MAHNQQTPCRRGVQELTRLMARADDTMVSVRHSSISCAETPFVSYNIDFSGPCVHECPRCHSKALWTVESGDERNLGEIMDYITELHSMGIINGICILGTDSAEKEEAVRLIVEIGCNLDTPVVIYTGYDIEAAAERYGPADYFVCGRYVDGAWDENKKFYAIVEQQDGSYYYVEINKSRYVGQRHPHTRSNP